jgi:outer membrane protein assembly factor BamB
MVLLFGQNLSLAADYKVVKNTSTIDLSRPLKKCWIYTEGIDGQEIADYASDKNNNENSILISTLISTENGKLELFDSTTKKPLWSSELGGRFDSNFVFEKESIYFISSNKTGGNNSEGNVTDNKAYYLKKLNKTTGLISRQTKLPFLSFNTNNTTNFSENNSSGKLQLGFSNEKAIVIAPNGNVYALDKDNGNEIWRREVDAKQPAYTRLFDNYIVVEDSSGSEKTLTIISADGAKLREFSTKEKMPTASYFVDDHFIFGNGKGTIYAFDFLNKSSNWKFRAGGEIMDITESVAGLLFSSKDNFMYLINSFTGKLLWRSRMPGRIFGKPLVYGRYVIVANVTEPEVDVIDIKNGKIVNRIKAEENDYFTGKIFLQNNFLILSTLNGLSAYSSDNCL